MGYDVPCTIRFDGKSARGTAWLEHKDLVFRGPFRVAIPRGQINEARASGGTLTVRFGDRQADLEIGPAAAKWAGRISSPPSRLDKLGVKPGSRVTVLGLDDEAFVSELAARGAVVSHRTKPGGADILFYSATTRASLEELAPLRESIAPAGAIWVVRPKGVKTITEADTMKAGKSAGLVDVKVVSFSETLTAEKFVIPVAARARVTPAAKRAAPSRPSSAATGKRESTPSRGRR